MTTYYFTYKTVNNINSMYYFGRHVTDDLQDGYIGSGVLLKQALREYGRENFTLTVLEFYESFTELAQAERWLVSNEVIADPMSYNVGPGGSYGWNKFHPQYKEILEKISKEYPYRDSIREDYLLKFKDGTTKVVHGFKNFCRDYKYDESAVYRVMIGQRKRHKNLIGIEKLKKT